MTDVKPVATVRHGPVSGLSGSQTAFVLPGSIRQIRDAPFGNGNVELAQQLFPLVLE